MLNRRIVVLGFSALCLAGSVFGQKGRMVLFDVPNAFGTTTTGINAFGTIAGTFDVRSDFPNSRGGSRGFVRSAGGTITTFEVPGTPWTFGGAINFAGTIGGGYLDSGGMNRGYLRDARGNFTLFESWSWVYDINDRGETTGTTGILGQGSGGFFRDAVGNFTFFYVPGGGSTAPSAINVHGTITGSYSDSSGWHGFVRERSGAITTFDVPGGANTAPGGINAVGTIFGSYTDAQNNGHSFVRDPSGHFTTFSTNRSCAGNPSIVRMNDFGAVVFNCGGDVFVREINGATLQIVAPPGSDCRSIMPTGINWAGVVAGYCPTSTSSPLSHGFIWMP